MAIVIGAATLAIFVMDGLTRLGHAVWALYLLPLLLTAWTPRPGTPLVLAAIVTVLMVVGFFLSPPGMSPVLAVSNRTIAVTILWATAWLLVQRQRSEVLLSGQRQVEEMIATGATLPETLNAIVRFIEAQAPGMLGSILVLDEDGVHIRHGAAPSLPAEYVAAIDGVSIGPRAGSCGTAAYRKEAVFVADIAADPLWADYKGVALPHGLRACWSTPIFDAQGDVLGTFAMYYRQSGLPRPYHRRLIDAATYTAAIALRRHREEAALRAKTEELDRYFTGSLDLLCIADTDGYFRRLNPEWERTLGYPLAALEGRRFLDFVHPDDLDATLDALRRLSSREQVLNFVNRYRHKDGLYRWIEWRSYAEGRTIYAVARDITERKRAEDQLQEREQQLSTLISNLPGAVFRVRNDANYTAEYVSDQIAELTGYPADDFRENRRTFGELMHPDDREWAWNEIQKALGDHRRYELTYRFIDAHGRERWNWEKGTGIDDANGELQAVEGFVQDITERRQAEEALRESEANYRTLIESASDGIFVTDPQGRYLDVNTAGCRMLGYTREEMLGLSVSDIVATAQKAVVAPELATLTAAKTLRREWQFRRKDGTLFLGEGSGTRLPDGRLLGILHDITERKQTEAALRQSEERLRLAVAGGGVGLWEWDVATGQLTWNDQVKAIFGLPAETTGLTLDQFVAAIHPEDRAGVERSFRAELEQHMEFKHEYRICRPDGTLRWILAIGRGDYDATGKPLRMRGAALDVTERKQAEEQLRAQLDELVRWYNVTLNREERVQELKREVNELLARLGERPRYRNPGQP